MKRLLTTITVAALALSLSACGASLEETKQQALDKVETLDLPSAMSKDGLKRKIFEAQTADKVQSIMEEAQAKIEKAQQKEEQRKKDEEAIASQIAGTYQYVPGGNNGSCSEGDLITIHANKTAEVKGPSCIDSSMQLHNGKQTWTFLQQDDHSITLEIESDTHKRFARSVSFSWEPGKNKVGDIYTVNGFRDRKSVV